MPEFCNSCIKNNINTTGFCSGCGNVLEMYLIGGHLPPETLLLNRYNIVTLIKTGGMLNVYKAIDNKFNSLCTVKELVTSCDDESEEKEITEWFKRGAILLACMDHPNLPKVLDYFVINERYYLIMTFIEGYDLESKLTNEGNPGLPEDNVIDWSIKVLEILDYLHNQDPPVVYRDIKPSNIMIHKDGRVMLVDFSIARTVYDDGQVKKTAIGTPGYAPEEQYKGKVEPRSDLYALGATIHHLLTGSCPAPFTFKPLRKVIPSISYELEDAVTKSLKDDIGERFLSARDMIDALSLKQEIKEIKEEEKPKSSVLNPIMILIPAGSFEMGSTIDYSGEKPVHNVEISSFYTGKYPVTNESYCAFLNSEGNQMEGNVNWINIVSSKWCGILGGPKAGSFRVTQGYSNRPVVSVSWYGAVAYCNWLSEKAEYAPCYGPINNRGNDPSIWLSGKGYRLPTEAEWEYACRGGTDTLYYWGDIIDGAYCWYQANSSGNHHEVGLKLPNSFGLYDMSGNVSEWCNDWYGPYPAATVKDPAGQLSGQARVPRGGSYCSGAFYCRSSSRSCSWPSALCNSLGFRLARSF
jgi:formylglycine-generating enzyme required for sulfatase activity